MPAVIVSSVNLSSFDFHTEIDIPNLTLTVDLSPTVWIGTGYNNVLGVKFAVTKLSGNTVLTLANPTPATYDLVPPNVQAGTVQFTLPTAFNAVEWGIYQITATLTDADGTQFVNTKSFDLCRPKQTGAEVNTSNASMNLFLDIKVRNGLGTAYDNTVYFYKQIAATSKVYSNAIYFDSTLGIPAITSTNQPPIQFALYTGKITFTSSDIVTYDLSDEFTVIIEYTGSVFKEVANIDFCKVFCCVQALRVQQEQNAGTPQGIVIGEKIAAVDNLLTEIYLGIDCGSDVSGLTEDIETITGCDCSCDCNGAVTPAPAALGSQSVNIIGTGGVTVTQSTAGFTTNFVVNGQTYSAVYSGSQATPEITISTSTSGNNTQFGFQLNLASLSTYFQTNLTGLGSVILYNDATDTNVGAGTGEQILKTYTLPAATGINTPLLTASKDGDEIEITAIMLSNTTAVDKTYKLYIGASVVAQFNTVTGVNELCILRAWIERKTNATQFYYAVIQAGVLTTVSYPSSNTLVLNLLATNVIKLTVTNTTSSANSSTARLLQVKLNKKS